MIVESLEYVEMNETSEPSGSLSSPLKAWNIGMSRLGFNFSLLSGSKYLYTHDAMISRAGRCSSKNGTGIVEWPFHSRADLVSRLPTYHSDHKARKDLYTRVHSTRSAVHGIQ